MSTVTTTTTASGSDGSVTTTTTTESTSVASTPKVAEIDTSLYEVREYYMDQTAFDAGEESGKPRKSDTLYGNWVKRFSEIGSMYFDIVCLYWKIPGEAEIRKAYPSTGDVEPNNFDKSHPNHAVVVHWVARWDSVEHMQQGWAHALKSETLMGLLGEHPYLKDFKRMESRFMKAILPPQRFMKADKVYEARRYTFNESKTPWNADTQQQYCDFVRDVMSSGDVPLKVTSYYIAQAPPMTTTVCGEQLAGGAEYAVEGVTAPHVAWVAEWDSVEQAREFYTTMEAAGIEALKGFWKSPAGFVNPFHPNPDVMLDGYERIEQSFMTAPGSAESLLD